GKLSIISDTASDEWKKLSDELESKKLKVQENKIMSDVALELISIKTVTDAIALIGKHSTNLDKHYVPYIALKRKKENLERKKEKFDIVKKEYALKKNKEKLKWLADNYSCYVGDNVAIENVSTTNCARTVQQGDDSKFISSANSCEDLNRPKYSKLYKKEYNSCRKVEKKYSENSIESAFTIEFKDLIATNALLLKEYELATKAFDDFNKDNKVNRELGFIRQTVDPDSDELIMQNWFLTENSASKIEFDPKTYKTTKKINFNLKIRFNNLLDSETDNRYLIYKNKDDSDTSLNSSLNSSNVKTEIIDVDVFEENNTPSIKFKLLEKRALKNNMEEFTGNYFEIILRRNETVYGVVYFGKVTKFNSSSVELGRGSMKMII
ncbi:MAG: hypothetical protein HQK51_19765, partial [Oligoflexia bacterium]|nr:hypothetical protein [Oligoflexia bacterium]